MENTTEQEDIHTPMTDEQKAQVIAWYDEQIALAEKRELLARLQSETIMHEAKRIQAVMMIAQMQGKDGGEETDLTKEN